MGMSEGIIDLYAIYLPPETLRQLAEKLCPEFDEEDYEYDTFSFDEDVALRMNGNAIYLSHFTGDAMLAAEGLDGIRKHFDDESFYHIPLSRELSLFGAAYSSIEEVINEVKEKTNGLLPEDFDYRLNVCHFVGSTFS